MTLAARRSAPPPGCCTALPRLRERAAALCVKAFSRIVLPVSCSMCGNPSSDGYPICKACREKMLASARGRRILEREAGRCAACGDRLISAESLCPECREGNGAFRFADKACALFSYTPQNAAILSAWKIAGNRLYSSIFAEILAAAFAASGLTAEECKARGIAIVPVPPRPGKIKKAGWDQIDELSPLSHNSHGLPVSACLVRSSREQQKGLGREERKANIRGQVSLKRGKAPPQAAILMDDIVTTGATADACAEALKDAGCRFVAVLALFRDG